MEGNPYEVDHVVASGEVMPQSYVFPAPDSRAYHLMTQGTNLSVHLVKNMKRYDQARAGLTDNAPWLSALAARTGANLAFRMDDIIAEYMRQDRWGY
jgi:hypothetical protein